METTENIDPDVAFRSSSFNERATRRIYSQSSFSTLSTRRATFSFCIPTTATPEFSTSYISSCWSLRLEFVTIPTDIMAEDAQVGFTPPLNTSSPGPDSDGLTSNSRSSIVSATQFDSVPSKNLPRQSMLSSSSPFYSQKPDLLQCIHKDDRTIVMSAIDDIQTEKFDCRIPIKVFPTNQDLAAMSFQVQPHGGYVI